MKNTQKMFVLFLKIKTRYCTKQIIRIISWDKKDPDFYSQYCIVKLASSWDKALDYIILSESRIISNTCYERLKARFVTSGIPLATLNLAMRSHYIYISFYTKYKKKILIAVACLYYWTKILYLTVILHEDLLHHNNIHPTN